MNYRNCPRCNVKPKLWPKFEGDKSWRIRCPECWEVRFDMQGWNEYCDSAPKQWYAALESATKECDTLRVQLSKIQRENANLRKLVSRITLWLAKQSNVLQDAACEFDKTAIDAMEVMKP